MRLRLAIPDLISPSYFPAIAAVRLGLFKGFEVELSLVYPVTKTFDDLLNARVDFVGGAAHAALYSFPDWQGCKLVCALAQNMYWFLVVRSDLDPRRGDLSIVRGLRIGAAPGPADGLRQLLRASGIDPTADVEIAPVPGTGSSSDVSFGLLAAKALQDRKIDAFWANGMGAEVAERSGTGKVVIDARRNGPEDAKSFTFPALVTTSRLVAQQPRAVLAAGRAIVDAQNILKADPTRATEAASKLFPPAETALIEELVRRDLPFYDPAISERSFDAMNSFAATMRLTKTPAPYREVVLQAQEVYGNDAV